MDTSSSLPAPRPLLIALAVILVLNPFTLRLLFPAVLYEDHVGYGRSMLPAIATGDRIVQLPHLYWFVEPRRGDIVTFPVPEYPGYEGRHYLKRIVALPGERVSIYNDRIYINGRVLEESYASRHWAQAEFIHGYVVPPGQYYVMGDNRDESGDSREFGPVPKGDLTRTLRLEGGELGGVPAKVLVGVWGWAWFLWPFICTALCVSALRARNRNGWWALPGFVLTGLVLGAILLLPAKRQTEPTPEQQLAAARGRGHSAGSESNSAA